MAPRFLVYTAFDLSVWIIFNNCYFPATIQISQESWILILLLSSQSLWRLFQRVRYKDINCFQNMLYKISRIELLKAVSSLLVWSFIMKNDIHLLNWNWMSKCCYIWRYHHTYIISQKNIIIESSSNYSWHVFIVKAWYFRRWFDYSDLIQIDNYRCI